MISASLPGAALDCADTCASDGSSLPFGAAVTAVGGLEPLRAVGEVGVGEAVCAQERALSFSSVTFASPTSGCAARLWAS